MTKVFNESCFLRVPSCDLVVSKKGEIMTQVKAQKTMRMVLNGKSSSNLALREAVGQIRELGHPLEVRVTWEDGDAARLAAEAIEDRIDTVIAAGGDGTINEVVNGLMKTGKQADIALAIVPLGTANDFATGCGIPTDNLLDALRLAAESEISASALPWAIPILAVNA